MCGAGLAAKTLAECVNKYCKYCTLYNLCRLTLEYPLHKGMVHIEWRDKLNIFWVGESLMKFFLQSSENVSFSNKILTCRHPEVNIACVDYLLGTPSFVCGNHPMPGGLGIWGHLGIGDQSMADKNTKNTATPPAPNTSNNSWKCHWLL